MDVFALRERVVAEYREYVESFVNILDERIDAFVRDRLAGGELWPEAMLQLNPAYEPGHTLRELAAMGVITPETARFFGPDLRLYRHQEEALEIARREEPYIVSTGTGSGKSLTYLIPIFDHVMRNRPDHPGVRAIIVYPMNALINSQLEALRRFRDSLWPQAPVTFARYTGQERELERQEILDRPPHILLTNYVMLEYMLIRPYERVLLQQATRELRFLVLDELHVYRGRQGADVAMLVRRLRQRAGRDLLLIGTSATIATQGAREERRRRIAETGSALFGVTVPAKNVVDETLRRVATVPAPRHPEELRSAVLAPPPEPTLESVISHPLAAWVEETFGLDVEDGRLVRRAPIAFEDGLRRLVKETGLEESLCRERLLAVLQAGNRAQTPSGDPVFAFRLHQFLSSGGSVFATIEHPDERHLTMEGQYLAPPRDGGTRLLYPLAFCRECGQEYYLASLVDGDEGDEGTDSIVGQRLVPRPPLFNALAHDMPGKLGYFAIEHNDLWAGSEEELPDFWFEQRAKGPRIRPHYQEHIPQRLWVKPDGTVSLQATDRAVEGWFQPRPLLLCLRCRAAYDRRENDFSKLATLSQIGRSTSTTILTAAAVINMRADARGDPAAKVLSFTDNRQDASLQAGHLNDFAQVVLLRGALVHALQNSGCLTFEGIGQSIFEAMGLRPEQFMKEPVSTGPGFQRARAAMIDLLTYRAFEDLRRGWRVAQPNLEQCGLLRIDYAGLRELAGDDGLWKGAPALGQASAERRERVLRAFLDHLRSVLAIGTECLTPDYQRRLSLRSKDLLREPWAIGEHETLHTAAVALLPGADATNEDEAPTIRLGARSAVGRYLRSRHTWDLLQDLSADEVEAVVHTIVAALRGHILEVVSRRGQEYGVRIMAGALVWLPGDGRAPGPDPIRARSLHLRRRVQAQSLPNSYFQRLYLKRATDMAGIVGREHTGQVSADDRRAREDAFRQGHLPALFCSPTMELGVDIADLSTVHMRNVPPTPTNYAQRSGRAGRGGRPALVLTFCSLGNAHDQYFFRRKTTMIAGAVAPPHIDLANRELIEAHLHSVWLATVGLALGSSMDHLLDLDSPELPIHPDKAAQLQLSPERQAEVLRAFRQVIGTDSHALAAEWLTDQWLEGVLQEAPLAFQKAFERWRELYRSAVRQRDAARRKIDSPRTSREERERAEQSEREARREIDLLLNRTGAPEESDFYPYRYLASEGFLPGYNFPRLPLRALVTTQDKAQAIDRPRFLGLSEFGPRNIIYHEGRKHRVVACVLPSGGIDSRITRAKICLECGYIHPRSEADVDLCQHCGTRLDGTTSLFPQRLFEQPTVRTARWARITADEEERAREGYRITTHFRFAPGEAIRTAEARAGDGSVLLELTYAPQAELWLINHGWRRTPNPFGFTLDQETGYWRRREDGEGNDELPEETERAPLSGVRPYVTDSRNLLLLRPPTQSPASTRFLLTLAYALQRGIQFVYQVEKQEVAVEVVGRGRHQRLLLWEAAEGGTGVWERLIERDGLASVATEALRICHFDPHTGSPDPAWETRCTAACYDCLLSYTNQLNHRFLDRHLVKDFLMQLALAETVPSPAGCTYEQHYRWIRERTDPASPLERKFLDFLFQQHLKLPDRAQHRPAPDIPVQPDFYYERGGLPGVCVFVDGPEHDEPAQARSDREVRYELEDRGYRLIVVRYDGDWQQLVRQHPDVFGSLD